MIPPMSIDHDAFHSIGPLLPTPSTDLTQQQPANSIANANTMTRSNGSNLDQQLPTDKRKKKWRKPKDKPKRPLSAYNLFFQLERQRLLDEGGPSPDLHAMTSKGKLDTSKKSKKYGFANLARHIATKWKTVDKETMAYYQALADKEQVRYMKDLVQWKIHEAQQKYDVVAVDDTSESKNSVSEFSTCGDGASEPSAAPPAMVAMEMTTASTPVSSSWTKSVVLNQEQDTAHQISAARCMGEGLFGGFDDGVSSNLSLIIQELAKEQAPTGASNNHEPAFEPLPLTTPIDYGTNMADAYHHIRTTLTMLPPLPPSANCFYGDYRENIPMPSSLPSPSMQQLTLDLDDEEQDFLISFLSSS